MPDIEKASAEYTGDSIQVLEGLEAVRKRPGMYIGSTSTVGLHHLVWEIVDNGVDEAVNGFGDTITVTINKDGSVTVSDEGRGIPCDIQPQSGLPAVQVIYTVLHSGGKFNNKNYASAAGLHGVGATVTNAMSEWCDVTVYRDGMIYHIRFENGGKLAVPLEVIGSSKKHGTTVRFMPDKTLFQTTEFHFSTICNHLREEAFLLKGIRFIVRDERVSPVPEANLYFENGLFDYVNHLDTDKKVIGEVIHFEGDAEKIHVEIAMKWCEQVYSEEVYSYANTVRTENGGYHESSFKAAVSQSVIQWGLENGLLKDKDKLEGTDIREGMIAVISVRVPEAILEYEGQTKDKLGTPAAAPAVRSIVMDHMGYFLSEHKAFAVDLINKCLAAKKTREAVRKAKEEARNGKSKKKEDSVISDKLASAQSKDYKQNELFIVEGDSAGGSAKTGRDRLHQAILPLRGKPLNVECVTMDKVRTNAELNTLIQTIGAGEGADFNIEDSHYGKIIIMTDADTDGAHIQTLLLTFFYRHMKPLIMAGMVYLACPPLYRVYKKSDPSHKFVYAWNDEDLEEAKKKIGPGYGINRYKGLGEMNADQLAVTTMNKGTRRLMQVRIVDPITVETRISDLMGNDASKRALWIGENIQFDEKDSFLKEVDQ